MNPNCNVGVGVAQATGPSRRNSPLVLTRNGQKSAGRPAADARPARRHLLFAATAPVLGVQDQRAGVQELIELIMFINEPADLSYEPLPIPLRRRLSNSNVGVGYGVVSRPQFQLQRWS